MIKLHAFPRLAAFFIGLMLLSVLTTGCCKKRPKDACPMMFNSLGILSPGGTRSCTCLASSIKGGRLWGTDRYTGDSTICTAAVHAGVIPATGGKVTVSRAKGCTSYRGSTRNGITSRSWGKYSSSYFFVQPGQPAPPCPEQSPSNSSVTPDKHVPAKLRCPRQFKLAHLDSKGELRCYCDPSLMQGRVWGTDTYTTDSSLCLAAVHAGVIDRNGGRIHAKRTGGCQRYVGSTAHGVTTHRWGAYGSSFYFPSKSSGQCK